MRETSATSASRAAQMNGAEFKAGDPLPLPACGASLRVEPAAADQFRRQAVQIIKRLAEHEDVELATLGAEPAAQFRLEVLTGAVDDQGYDLTIAVVA